MTFEIDDLEFKAEPTMREHGEPGTFTLVHGDAEWHVAYRFGVEMEQAIRMRVRAARDRLHSLGTE